MSRPTLTSILPRTGHTGGGTLVEIRGTGFALPPPPPARGKAPVQPSRVRVLFGGVPATEAETASAEVIFCKTPEQDPIDRRVLVTGEVATSRLLATAHGAPNGTRVAIRLRPDGTGAPPVGALPSPLEAGVPYYVVGATADALQLSWTRGGAPVALTSSGSGSIELVFYGAVEVTVQNLAETPATLTSAPGPFVFGSGDTVEVLLGDVALLATVGPADVATPGAATALEAAAILSRLAGVRADVVDGRVRLRSDARGAAVTLAVVGGVAGTALGFDPAEADGSTDLVPVDEEAVAVPAAYTFARPDLGRESHVVTVIRTVIRALKREVLRNVHMATNTDYDAETGDLVNSTLLAELPSIVLADLRMPENRDESTDNPTEDCGADDETYLVREPDHVVDVRFTLIGVAEDPVETLNLVTVVQRFFRKHHELVVALEEGGTAEYEMQFLTGSSISVSLSGDNPNAQSFTGEMVIKGVPVGDMAIEDQGDLPEGVPAGTRYEGVRDIGWVQADDTNLEVVNSDETGPRE